MTILAAAVGTAAFAALFGVPRRYEGFCALIGAAGWAITLLCGARGLTAAESTFFATVLVALLSRFFAVWERCPATVFLVSGIIPLVPGAGIYWTAYDMVTGRLGEGLQEGFGALKISFAIVLGIVLVFELPGKLFHLGKGKKKR